MEILHNLPFAAAAVPEPVRPGKVTVRRLYDMIDSVDRPVRQAPVSVRRSALQSLFQFNRTRRDR